MQETSTRRLEGLAPALVSLTLLLAPALGSTHEELLQDTLKSAVVSFGVLLAALAFFASRRRDPPAMRWHLGLLLPVLLMVYALGSMAWAHTYLAGVEAVRWFIFSLLMFVALNTLTRERLPLIAWGVAGGCGVASLWTVLQFFFDFSLFPQGPHPASTFVNRNFFAELAVCSMPFVAMLLANARKSSMVALLSALAGLVILALCMTGTRGALVSLWLLLLVVFPLVAWRFRAAFAFPHWPVSTRVMSLVVIVGIVAGLGMVPTTDRELAGEGKGVTALERAFARTASINPHDSSLSLRMIMWRATGRMIVANSITGVGAGGWEYASPLYQAEGTLIETDFYVHNEFLQLIAEYGLVGWWFLIGLFAWLVLAARRTWKLEDAREAAWRAVLLASLLCLMIVSNVGFAWRLAATGALFAVCLGALAASDMRIATAPRSWWREFQWSPALSTVSMAAVLAATGLAVTITSLAVECEYKIVRASRLALTISASGDPFNSRWNASKAELLTLLKEGIAINPHYRKLTPFAADELARWGDWKDAIWIWESVLSSRPYVAAILTNVTRGYIATGDFRRAVEYLDRAKRLQPNTASVRSAEVLLYVQSGHDAEALQKGRIALSENLYDFDLCNALYVVGRRQHDYAIAEQAMQLRIVNWQRDRVQALLFLGDLYEQDMHRPDDARGAYSRALETVPPASRSLVWERIPAAVRSRIDPALAPQMSASKG